MFLFPRKSRCQGLIMSVQDSPDTANKLKDILETCESLPPVHTELIELIKWFTDYYQCTPYKKPTKQ